MEMNRKDVEGRGRYATSVIVHLMKMNRNGWGRKRSLCDFNNCTFNENDYEGCGRKRSLSDFSNCTFNENE